MNLKYLGHASVLIEAGGRRILTDPWLHGPAHYHGWWHVPPAVPMSELGRIDYVTISHVHDDHFHLPTLELLPKGATVVIQHSFDSWMAETLREMGFARVIELDHGRIQTLEPGLRIANFQFGRIDSAFWLSTPTGSLLNLNDCPVTQSWVQSWLRRFPAPDIALGAFSYASPYPVCYQMPGTDRDLLIKESVERVLAQFGANMRFLQPKVVIPFATQYGFLLPEQLWMNEWTPTPQQAIRAVNTAAPDVHCVMLNPGGSFTLATRSADVGPPFDWARRSDAVAQLARDRSSEVQEALAAEPPAPPDLAERVRAGLSSIISKNWLLRRSIRVPIRLATPDTGHQWTIDCRDGDQWVRSDRHGEPAPIEIRIPSRVLAAAIDGRIHWENVYLSNRLEIRTGLTLLDQEWALWRMLFNFPEGLLRDRLRVFTPRGRRVLWHRRGEIARTLTTRLLKRSEREPY